MKRMKWEIDGEKVIGWINDYSYYCTNGRGEGIFFVDLSRNERKQLTGTCQFSVYGLKPKSKKSKLRTWLDGRVN